MTKSKAIPADSEWARSPKQTIVYTTFVETDSHNFRELVQKLTGVAEGVKLPVTLNARNSSKGRIEAGNKSDGSCCALIKSEIEAGIPPQKSSFKLHQRRQFQKKLEIEPGFYHDPENTIRFAGNNCVLSPTLVHSPITPLGPAHPYTSSASYCYSSTPTSCNQSPYLAEEEQFCFQPSPSTLKREPQLLPLFPLHSPTQPRST